MEQNLKSKYAASLYARIFLSTISVGELSVFCGRLSRAVRAGASNKVSLEELDALSDHLADLKPQVPEKDFLVGVKFLNNIALTPKGTRRVTSFSAEFTDFDLEVLRTATHCQVNGVVEIGGGYLPEFRVHGYRQLSTGDWVKATFCYFHRSWQRGKYFEITSHA